jgi:hypothetical protein
MKRISVQLHYAGFYGLQESLKLATEFIKIKGVSDSGVGIVSLQFPSQEAPSLLQTAHLLYPSGSYLRI